MKRRHRVTQEEWIYVWDNYEKLVDKPALMKKAKKTVDKIVDVCKGKKVAYAWSGGKDSVVLALLCEQAGIHDGMGAYSDLFFKSTIKHLFLTKPNGVELIHTGHNMDWLFQNQKYLFMDNMFAWYKMTHLKAQEEYYNRNKLDFLIKGKRTQDDNVVKSDLIYTSKRGYSEFNPINDWTHEEVIAYMRYNGKTLSPFYFTKHGFHYGDCDWASMNVTEEIGDINGMWEYIESIDRSVVLEAAKGIDSAREYLRQKIEL